MISNWERRLIEYRDGDFQKIEGYGTPDVLNVLLPAIMTFHEAIGLNGDVGEIGVHHGRLFCALDALRSKGERCIGADVFEWQDMNVDASGKGNRLIFEANIKKLSHDPDSIEVYQGDSLDLRFRRHLADKDYQFRIVSIDGGHTVQHAMSDLRVVEDCLKEGGVILLDDFMNPGFPGVTEAVYQYLHGDTKLCPVWTVSSKLVFVSISNANRLRAHIASYVPKLERRVRKTIVGGHEVLWLVPKR
jgi:SAM-dependent methyltransferase